MGFDDQAVAVFEKIYLGTEASNIQFLATKEDVANVKGELKEDIANLRSELSNVKGELKEDIANLRSELANVKGELKEDIAGVKGEVQGLRSQFKVLYWIMGIGFGGLFALLSAIVSKL
jgi:predicted nuclease with TOPRIM domain